MVQGQWNVFVTGDFLFRQIYLHRRLQTQLKKDVLQEELSSLDHSVSFTPSLSVLSILIF